MKHMKIDEMVYSIVTVGERGQLVIPAEARKDCNISPGDKLIVLKDPIHHKSLTFAKLTDLQEIHDLLSSRLDELRTHIEKIADEEEKL